MRYRELWHDMRNDHVEAGEHRVLGFHAVRHSRAHVANEHTLGRIADVDAGRLEPDAHALAAPIELVIVETRQHHVIHGLAGRNFRDERTHQKPSERSVAVWEVIDVRLPYGAARQAQAVEARVAQLAGVGGRHGVASKPEEAERAALKTVRHFFAAAAHADKVVAVTRPLHYFQFLLRGLAAERIASAVVKSEQLRLARGRDRKSGDEFG